MLAPGAELFRATSKVRDVPDYWFGGSPRVSNELGQRGPVGPIRHAEESLSAAVMEALELRPDKTAGSGCAREPRSARFLGNPPPRDRPGSGHTVVAAEGRTSGGWAGMTYRSRAYLNLGTRWFRHLSTEYRTDGMAYHGELVRARATTIDQACGRDVPAGLVRTQICQNGRGENRGI